MKKIIGLFALGTMALSPLTSYAQANLDSAKDYLTAHAENPWSTMGLRALGASSIPSDYLKSVSGTTAIEYAAPILAITSLNQDPRTFGNKDLIAELKKFHTDNQIGDVSTVNDDIFGLLALVSAGEPTSNPMATDAKTFILAHRQSNGGWGFATSGGTDSNMTASAIVALIADGVSATDPVILNGLDYLKTTQNDDGGFTYDPESPWGTASDSSSTAWVIWALNSTGINPADWAKSEHTPIQFLESNQTSDGYFQYQTGFGEDSFSATTTAYAVIALAGKTLPLNIFAPPVPVVTPTNIVSTGSGTYFAPVSNNPPIVPTPVDPVIPPGEVLGALTFTQGTLVKTADNQTVYIVSNNKFRPFSSEKIFAAYGLKFSDVQIVGSDIITTDSTGTIMDYPDGTPHE